MWGLGSAEGGDPDGIEVGGGTLRDSEMFTQHTLGQLLRRPGSFLTSGLGRGWGDAENRALKGICTTLDDACGCPSWLGL